MDTVELFERLGLALAIGFLVGIERGWRERGEGEGGRTAGLRTFALSGVLGGLTALVARELGAAIFAVVFLGFAGAVTLFKWRESRDEHDYSVTTVVAAMLVFVLGGYAVVGHMALAAAAAVVTAALLAFKTVLHRWVAALSWPEIRSAIVLLAMTFVALPLLPDRAFGPFGAFNPHEIWLLTVLIATVSFSGYVATRVVGERRGLVLTAFVGGLVSSTAVTLDMARRSREPAADPRLLASGACLSGAVMFVRILIVAVLIDQRLWLFLAPAFVSAAAVAGLFGLAYLRIGRSPAEARSAAIALGNPFELATVLRFGALLSAVMLLANALQAWFGPQSALWLAAAAGLADVDAVTLSMARGAGSTVPATIAVLAILVVASSNSFSKSVLSVVSGSAAFAWRHVAAMVASVAVMALVYTVTLPLLPPWP